MIVSVNQSNRKNRNRKNRTGKSEPEKDKPEKTESENADQVYTNKLCTEAKNKFEALSTDATAAMKAAAQKQVDSACKSGADQEWIRNYKIIFCRERTEICSY